MSLACDVQEILDCQAELKANQASIISTLSTLMDSLGNVATLEELCEKVDAQDECLAEIKEAVICTENVAVTGITLNGMSAPEGAFQTGDVIDLLDENGEALGTATVGQVSGTKYELLDNTVAEANLTAVTAAVKKG